MEINKLIVKLNNYLEENNILSLDDLSDELVDELKNYNFHFIKSVGTDEHRWYILKENVYGITIDGTEYFIGIWEVGTLKSESMSLSDCWHQLSFHEMEEYTTVSYRRKS